MAETRLVLEILGACQIKWCGEPLSFKTQKSQALLVYLLVEAYFRPDVRHSRQQLAELLWPGLPIRSSLENLRQAIYRLKQALPPDLRESGLIAADRQYLWIGQANGWILDLENYQEAIRQPIQPDAFYHAHGAVPNFLAHFYLPDNHPFEDWVTGKRRHIREMVVDQLTQSLLAASDPEAFRLLRRELLLWHPEASVPKRPPILLSGNGKRPIRWSIIALGLMTVLLLGSVFWGLPEQSDYSAPDAPVPEAYDHYLKGRSELFKENYEGLNQARSHFLKALEIDPSYAEAHLQYASTMTALCSWWGEASHRIQDNYPIIERHLTIAAQEPDLYGSTLTIFGWAHIWQFRLDSAVQKLERALAICDCVECTLTALAQAHTYRGEWEVALDYAERAQEANPTFSWNYFIKGEILGLMGAHEQASEAFEQYMSYSSNDRRALVRLAWLHLQQREPEPAIQLLDSLYQTSERPVYFLTGHLAAAYAMNQQPERARLLITEMQKLHQQGYQGYAYYLGLTYHLLDELDEAVYWLKRSLAIQEIESHWVHLEPLLSELSERFREEL